MNSKPVNLDELADGKGLITPTFLDNVTENVKEHFNVDSRTIAQEVNRQQLNTLKKKNNEEKEVKTQAEKQEEKETEATDKAEKSAEENPLEKELKDTKEQLLRVTAEYSNFRKRSEKEKNESFAFATIKAVSEILATVDNLERAIASEQEDYEGLKKGVQMTYDGLMASLEKLGVTAYGEQGEQFDPNLHHAVMHIDDDSLDANVITDVFQKGYKYNDKVVRPAMVKTAN